MDTEITAQKAKASLLPQIFFAVGLAVWPLLWTLEELYKTGMIQNRDFIDDIAYKIILVGIGCCAVAPLLSRAMPAKKIVFSLFGVWVYVLAGCLCYFGFLILFGGPRE